MKVILLLRSLVNSNGPQLRMFRSMPFALSALEVILEVVNGVSASDALFALSVLRLGIEKLLPESREIGLVGLLFDHNLFPVV
jgi:hypothetical protein